MRVYVPRTPGGATSQLRISPETLGELALPDFCPRCFWLKLMLLAHKL